jgi:hypothetical protein
MKKPLLPLFITVKDVQRITGLSYGVCKKKLSNIRKQLNKPPRSPVLRREYCSATQVVDEDLYPYYV